MPKHFDYSKYCCVPSWSSLPIDNYSLVDTDGSRTSALSVVGPNTAAWNLYWALAERCDVDSEEPLVDLVRLPIETEKALLRLPRFRYTLVDTGGMWTVAAMMCRFAPEELMSRYWPNIAGLVKLPLDRGHLFSE
jgi:hypothetical protein